MHALSERMGEGESVEERGEERDRENDLWSLFRCRISLARWKYTTLHTHTRSKNVHAASFGSLILLHINFQVQHMGKAQWATLSCIDWIELTILAEISQYFIVGWIVKWYWIENSWSQLVGKKCTAHRCSTTHSNFECLMIADMSSMHIVHRATDTRIQHTHTITHTWDCSRTRTKRRGGDRVERGRHPKQKHTSNSNPLSIDFFHLITNLIEIGWRADQPIETSSKLTAY